MIRRTTWAGLLAAAALALSGCVGMPSTGPVQESQSSADPDPTPGIAFDPLPPQPGETPTEIVSNFLEAMKATPLKTTDAQLFLTRDAQERWAPEQQILTYADLGDPVMAVGVRLPLSEVNSYDERGAWQRAQGARTVEFGLVREGEEWRIDQLPDALIVPEWWFEDWYQRVSLYYFDPTAQIIVPEPVFAPRGDQFASALVRGLLSAAPEGDSRVTRSFFPTGLSHGVSVPISAGGIAEVSLGGDPDAIDDETAQRMLVQLVWTLRQEPRINAVRLSVGDRVFGAEGGATQVNLDVGSAYDPNGAASTPDLFALSEGVLVRGTVRALDAVAGPFGVAAVGVRSFAVDLPGERAAAVSSDGTALLTGPVALPDSPVETAIAGALDLLEPSWDFAGRAWVADRAGREARVLVVTDGVAREVRAPGITGQRVRQLRVSRDGSRLLAVVRGAKVDRVVVSRVQHGDSGRVVGVGPAVQLALPDAGLPRISDVAWRSPTAVSVLGDINDELVQIRTVSVDGAPGEVATEGSTTLRGRIRRLVMAPLDGSEVFAVGGRQLTDVTTPERDLGVLPEGLASLTYAG